LEGNPARICLPPFRVSHSPQGIHKINETSSGCFKTAGHSSSDLLGRHTNHGGVAGLSITPCSINLEPLGGPRFYSQLQKVPVSSLSKIEFLGFLIDSTNLTLQLPGEKLRKIRKKCQNLLERIEISVRELSKFLGLLTSSIQAIFQAPLHYRHLQRLKNTTMTSEHSYEALLTLDTAAREEVLWWRDHLQGWNGRALFQQPVDLIIETDSSRSQGAHGARGRKDYISIVSSCLQGRLQSKHSQRPTHVHM
jgi:hypothetical protein